MSAPPSPATGRATVSDAVRRILGSAFRRRSPSPPGPDFDLPAPIAPSGVVVEPGAAEQWLTGRVDELAARGALDEGHGGLFDADVDTVVEVWAAGVSAYRQAHAEHVARLDRIAIDLDQTAAWLRVREAGAVAEIAGLTDEIGRRVAELDAAAAARRRRPRRWWRRTDDEERTS